MPLEYFQSLTRGDAEGWYARLMLGSMLVSIAMLIIAIADVQHDVWHLKPVGWVAVVAWFLLGIGLAVVFTDAYREAVWRRNRFDGELRQARQELAILSTPELREAYCRKYFIRITGDEKRILEEYAKRMNEVSWIEYVERRRSHGGSLILEAYRKEVLLLRLAKRIDATTSFAEHRTSCAEGNLHVARTTILGEEEIARDRDELRRGGEPKTPWEKFL